MTDKTITKKSAVVFGATGLVGRELIAELIENNKFDKIVAVARKPLSITDPKFQYIHLGGFSDLMDLKEKLKTDVYFCCIGTTIKKAGSQEAFQMTDLEIPVKIAQLARALSVPSLVIISSLGANKSSSNFYLRTKGEMEESVRKTYDGNLKFVRPSLLMGKRDESRFGEKAAVVFMKIFGWLFAGPIRKYKGISASDVARSMIIISNLSPGKIIYESDELHDLLKLKSE